MLKNKQIRLFSVWLLLAILTYHCEAQKFAFLSFNTENLFDTIPSKANSYNEFTPLGEKKWNSARYWRKINKVAEAISQAGGSSWPWFVALQEVENSTVIENLVHCNTLKQASYKFVVSNGNDPRGINVALLYGEGLFVPTEVEEWHIPFPLISEAKHSRPILYCKGKLLGQYPIGIMVVHLPSKRGGDRKSKPFRQAAYSFLQQKCDSLNKTNPTLPLIVVGDYNSTPNESISCQWATPLKHGTEIVSGKMYDLSLMRHKESLPGSHYFMKVYSQIDRIVVSHHLLMPSPTNYLQYCRQSFTNCTLIGNMRTIKGHRAIPKRTYGGNTYIGGCSDHLPIRAEFELSPIINTEEQ